MRPALALALLPALVGIYGATEASDGQSRNFRSPQTKTSDHKAAAVSVSGEVKVSGVDCTKNGDKLVIMSHMRRRRRPR